MNSVFVTTYEVIGDGLPIAQEFYAQVDAARKAHWAFTESVGGVGFRPAHWGSIASVLFEELPEGWKQIGRNKGRIEAAPRKTSKVGKALVEAMKSLPATPKGESLAGMLGYNPSEMAMDGYKVYFASELRTSHPTERVFVRIPRFSSDGFEPNPAMLRALPESEFMKAIEDHNAEARRLREAEPAEA